MLDKKHIGSDFDEFLYEEGIADETEAAASKRMIAFQIEEEMRRRAMTKSELARRMQSSRSAVDRLLDPGNSSVTLATLTRAAHAVGKKLVIQLVA